MPDLSRVAAEVDAVLPETALVYGSAPRRASDLDLLVRPAARRALEQWLPAAGFTSMAAGWVRVGGGLTAVVDLRDVERWRLPADQADDLFARARPLEGFTRLARPAPQHALLVLARRLQEAGGRLEHRRLARGRQALVEDPGALTAAIDLAEAWGCVGALEVLGADLQGQSSSPERRRLLLAQDGVALRPAWRAAASAAVPRRPAARGAVIAVSGLDGSGKSTLVNGLFDALDSLDLEPVVLWQRISYGRTLQVLAAPAKAARRGVHRARGRGPTVPVEPVAAPPPVEVPDRRFAPVIDPPASGRSTIWPLVVTLVHVLSAGPVTRWHLRRGRTVIRDRYALDALVHMRHRYREAAPEGLHRALLTRLQPRPAVALLLDVPAEVAWRRKPEQWDLEQLTDQRELYLRHAEELGVHRLDGTCAPGDLHDRVIPDVLAALGLPTS